ncbi:MAG: DUF4350 domain-containing protein [Candidatus Methanosuratincola sp.]
MSALVVIAAIVATVPSVDDFSLDNPYWNGMSSAASALRLSDRSGARPDPSWALIIAGPDVQFDADRVSELRSFLEDGGCLLLLDDFGTGNSLLEGLGVGVRINGSVLADPLFMHKSQRLPRASPAGGTSGQGDIFLDYASVLEVGGGSHGGEVSVLYESSPFSYLDVDTDGRRGPDEPTGPFPVAAEVVYGKGKLVVVSDSSLLINSVLEIGGYNAGFVGGLVGGRAAVVVDYGNNAKSAYSQFRSAALVAASYPEARYALALAAAALLFRIDPASLRKGGEAPEGELAATEEAHPDWDRGLLKELWDELKAHRQGAPAAGSLEREGKRNRN